MKETVKMNFEKEYMISFIQKNTEKYITKFKNMEKSDNMYSWNWAAFLFGGFWFMYRKMYIFGIGVEVLTFLLQKITNSYLFAFIIPIILGIVGNYLYLNHCNKKLNNIMDLHEQDKEVQIEKQGGVSIIAVILLIAANMVFSAIEMLRMYHF